MTWQTPTNDSTGFWDQYSREMPGLISVPLHISLGIHTEGDLTHFCRDHPPVCTTVDVCTFSYMKDGIVWLTCLGSAKICLSAKMRSTEPHRSRAQRYEAANTHGCSCKDPHSQNCVCLSFSKILTVKTIKERNYIGWSTFPCSLFCNSHNAKTTNKL